MTLSDLASYYFY